MGTVESLKAEHTAGPWEVKWNGMSLTVGTPSTNMNRMHDYLVAETGGNSFVDEANAHLVAAAPDLLAALKEMVWTFEKLGNGKAITAARAAILKAEGARQ